MMNPTDASYPIRPEHISVKGHFWGAFDHNETEVSAKWIVRLCQERGGWLPFTYEQINELYERSGKLKRYTFNRLVVQHERSWIRQDGDTYHITHDFVSRCFGSSPAVPPAPEDE
jgi:hypothetical protein